MRLGKEYFKKKKHKKHEDKKKKTALKCHYKLISFIYFELFYITPLKTVSSYKNIALFS